MELTSREQEVFNIVKASEGCHAGHLIKKTGISRGNIRTYTRVLEAKGLIKAEIDKFDNRVKIYTINP